MTATLPYRAIPTIPLADLWFEPGHQSPNDKSRLMLAIAHPLPEEVFHVDLVGGSLTFRMIGDIKGRRVFEATEWRPADDPGQVSQDPSWRPSGPFRGGAWLGPSLDAGFGTLEDACAEIGGTRERFTSSMFGPDLGVALVREMASAVLRMGAAANREPCSFGADWAETLRQRKEELAEFKASAARSNGTPNP